MVYRPDAVVTIDEYVLGDEVVLFQDRGAFRAVLLLQKSHSFLSFPYVCPEPVLVQCSFLYRVFKWRRKKWGFAPTPGSHRRDLSGSGRAGGPRSYTCSAEHYRSV
jgi:hypothetical protein